MHLRVLRRALPAAIAASAVMAATASAAMDGVAGPLARVDAAPPEGGDYRPPQEDVPPPEGGDYRPPKEDVPPPEGGDYRPPKDDVSPPEGGDYRPPKDDVPPPAKLVYVYDYRAGSFSQLELTGVDKGERIAVTLTCPRKVKCPKRFTATGPASLRLLLGVKLAPGTTIDIRARLIAIGVGIGPTAIAIQYLAAS
jgi:hypothetical protein